MHSICISITAILSKQSELCSHKIWKSLRILIDAVHRIHTESYEVRHHRMIIQITTKRQDFIKFTKKMRILVNLQKNWVFYQDYKNWEFDWDGRLLSCLVVFESFGHPAEWPLVSWSLVSSWWKNMNFIRGEARSSISVNHPPGIELKPSSIPFYKSRFCFWFCRGSASRLVANRERQNMNM